MIFTLGNYVIDVDVDRTREAYARLPLLSDDCQCRACRNWVLATDALHEGTRIFFAKIGIDLKKVFEAHPQKSNEERTSLLYEGTARLYGKILKGEAAMIHETDVEKVDLVFNEAGAYPVASNFKICFDEYLDIPDGVFRGDDIIEMYFRADMPLVLDEKI